MYRGNRILDRTSLRTYLNLAALAALLALWAVTAWEVAGPHPLPARIPTHFDIAGHPNAWGQPAMLWMLPVIVTVILGLMSLVARRPRSFNFPVRVTPANRPRLESVALDMIAWLRLEIAGAMLWIQYATIQSARALRLGLSPWFVPITIAAVLATIVWHVRQMVIATRRP